MSKSSGQSTRRSIDLAVDALVCEHAGGLEREVQRRAVGDDRHVARRPGARRRRASGAEVSYVNAPFTRV